jgi:hypothetical protein
VLLDFNCTPADLSDPVRSRGFDDFAWRRAILAAAGVIAGFVMHCHPRTGAGEGAAFPGT